MSESGKSLEKSEENSPKKTRAAKKTKASREENKEHPKDFFVVGLGASAGGLSSLEKFFNNMTAASGIAFVIVTHMEPDHHSMMPELLQRETAMPVRQVEDGMIIEPDHIYIIPPDHDMAVMDGALQLMDRQKRTGSQSTINFFLRALAEDFQEKAIAVIMSGTGTDGSLGIKSIKEKLGMVMAESQETAQYRGMPESAINTGMVDYVLPAGEMPEKIIAYIKQDKSRRKKEKTGRDTEAKAPLKKIFFLLRNKTGHDFSNYKRNTITRRIDRRMNIHQIGNLDKYVHYLQQNEHEIELLFKELLIGVTNFFRDPEAFQVMKEKVFPLLLDEKSQDYNLRIWIPGTATGEEAYSIAILLHEYMMEKEKTFRVQIFATDIDEDAVEKARSGEYTASISNDVSPERLRNYFERQNNSYVVRRDIREMLIFASQNIIKDPPFIKIDLICCRNLLIYLDGELQRKLLPLFHYSLKPGGILFLGSSETIGHHHDLFSTIDSRWKIYKANPEDSGRHPVIEFPLSSSRHREAAVDRRGEGGPGINDITEKKLLAEYAPSAVVINRRGEILYVHGRTGKYLEPAEGTANWNILEMAREGLKFQIPSLIRKANSSEKAVTRQGIRIKTNGDVQIANVTVRPLKEFKDPPGLLLVTFEEVETRPELQNIEISAEKQDDESYRQLEQELKSTKENLQTTIEELETSNEELKSMNEEYQSTNEELKSANEELETSREELQSLNEELTTVNSELQEKVINLNTAHLEMQSLLNNLELPTIFLDNDLCLKKFTVQVKDLIRLIEKDYGRPIDHIATNFTDDTMVQDAQQARDTLQVKEKEIQTRDGRWYLRRIIPYRTSGQEIDGVVITFRDIHQRRALREELEELKNSREDARLIMETIHEPLLILNGKMKVLSANSAFYQKFHARKAETLGHFLYALGDNQWDIPRLRELLEEVLPDRKTIDNFEVAQEFPEIGYRKMLLNSRRMEAGGEGEEKILLAFRDVTEP